MSDLLGDRVVRVTHRLMEQDKTAEHHVATMVAALHNVYFHEPSIVLAPEKPPTNHASDRQRKVDAITHWWPGNTWNLLVGAVWEFKKPNATPSEIETCEGQVLDACERYLRGTTRGECYGFSVIGSFWRVFIYEKPGSRFISLTGEGPADNRYYFDISDHAEGQMIDSCLRDLWVHMGYSRHAIRSDVAHLYPPSTLKTNELVRVYNLKRDGWIYRAADGKFFKQQANGAWIENRFRVSAGLPEVMQAFE